LAVPLRVGLSVPIFARGRQRISTTIPNGKMRIFMPLKKVFKILFVFYFITLAVIPCYDKDECGNETELTQVSQQNEKTPDLCTPFCICSTCVTFFEPTSPVNSTAFIAVVNSSYSQQTDSKAISISIPVWQPPKLSC
jgi:hypothetical protein